MTQTPIPSPQDLLLSLVFGLFAGLGPGLIVMIGLRGSWQTALLFLVVALVIGIFQHVMGWFLLVAPFKATRALWRMINGTPAPPPALPQAQVRTHWMQTAAFWSGLSLTSLLFLYAELQEKVS